VNDFLLLAALSCFPEKLILDFFFFSAESQKDCKNFRLMHSGERLLCIMSVV
jgi:hypothetical protein